ncbi:hypothetical protein A4X03_0g9766, partial [Tilletia caries]
MAVSNASRLNSFEELFKDRLQPVSQLKVFSDAYAVAIVDSLHKYRAQLFDEARLRQELASARQRGDQAWQAFLATNMSEDEVQRVGRVRSDLQQVQQLVDQYIARLDGGQLRSIDDAVFNRELYTTFDPLGSELEALIALQLSEGEKLGMQTGRVYASMRNTFIAIGAVALLLVLLIALLISLSIIRPLSALRGVISEVQQSANLTLRADVAGRDEVADTARA